jgi:hypothetical protein
MNEDARTLRPQGLSAGLPNRRAVGKLRAARLDDQEGRACPHTQTRVIATARRPRFQAPGWTRRHG